MFGKSNSSIPPTPGKWEDKPVTDLPPQSAFAEKTVPALKKNTECAAQYSQAYFDSDFDQVLKLCHPNCQFGTFFGFVYGPTALRIALLEEQKMNMKFVGKIQTYSTSTNSANREKGKAGGSFSPVGAIHRAWFAPTDAGLHKGPGAPSFFRVTENIFERDGYAKRNHRSFPWMLWDMVVKLRVRETIVVDDGKVVTRVLQNTSSFIPMPYDFM